MHLQFSYSPHPMRFPATNILSVATVCGFLLAACGNSERVALENYSAIGEKVGETISEAGSKFETLMNVVQDPTAWTVEEKKELQVIINMMDSATVMAGTMQPPAIIKDIHPLLPRAIGEMRSAIIMMAELANDPENTTEEKLSMMSDAIESGDKHITEYMDKMEMAIGEKYPDLAGMEE